MIGMTNDYVVLEPLELQMLRLDKQSGYNYRWRRQEQWRENYDLYRDKVLYNRLTQRQSVNVPLMKKTIRTLLKDVDDMPVMYLENLDNDKEAETFLNEYWKLTLERNHMEINDIVDKRQVMLKGRTFEGLQIIDGYVSMTVECTDDFLVDRYMNPANLDSSRFLIHMHIFRPLTYLEKNPEYDGEAITRLKSFYGSQNGLIKAKDNLNALTLKNEKLADLGVQDVESPVLGETYVEMTLHFRYHSETPEEEEQIYLFIEVDDTEILLKKPLEEIIDPQHKCKDHYWRNHYPYTTWADDLDSDDFWTDGIADIVRTPNKVLNSWFSQLVENRTLRNFGMNYYDATIEGFTPSTFEPKPFGWYPVPGKPQDVFQKVDIPDLGDESINEINLVQGMVEAATGATATQQGVQTEKNMTLGEIQLDLGEAKQRSKGMSKFYTPAWKERAHKFLKLVEAGSDRLDEVKIYKKGRNTNNIYGRQIGPKDWETASGYQVKVWSQDDKDEQDQQAIQKLSATAQFFPGNPKFMEIQQRKMLEFDGLKPDEINEVMKIEEEKQQALQQGQGMMPGAQPGMGVPGAPMTPQPTSNLPFTPPGQPQLAAPQPNGGMPQ